MVFHEVTRMERRFAFPTTGKAYAIQENLRMKYGREHPEILEHSCRLIPCLFSGGMVSKHTKVLSHTGTPVPGFTEIEGNGDCLFNAVSALICGDQKKLASVLRHATADQIRQSNELYEVNGQSVSGTVYLERTNRHQPGVYATTTEIRALAHVIGVDIIVNSVVAGKDGSKSRNWLQFNARSQLEPAEEACFITHVNRNHYEVVLTVE